MKKYFLLLVLFITFTGCNKQVDDYVVPQSKGKISLSVDGELIEITSPVQAIKSGSNPTQLSIGGSTKGIYFNVLIREYNGVGIYDLNKVSVNYQITNQNPSPIYVATLTTGSGTIRVTVDEQGIVSGLFEFKVINKTTLESKIIEGGSFQIKY